MTDTGLVADDLFLGHDPGPYRLRGSGRSYPFVVPHPSDRRLVEGTRHLLALTGHLARVRAVPARPATDAELVAIHAPAYLARVLEVSASGGGDTGLGAPIGPGGEAIARLAAGGALAAVDAVMEGQVRHAFALVRPPGHHAMPDQGMGFCVYNNVAIAAAYARRRWALTRVLVLDWDVHHGNGTQAAFADDPTILFISVHQDELYPHGWGGVEQVGTGAAVGFTVNLPLPAGAGDATYAAAFDRLILPIVLHFRPELILVSAGQDASNADPLGRMCVTTDGYRAMTAAVMRLAATCCQGRLVLVQEGGYSEWYGPYCTLAVIETLLGVRSGIDEPFPPDWIAAMPPTTRVSADAWAALESAHDVLRAYWPL